MFTGLIETTGKILSIEQRSGSHRVAVHAPGLKLRIGDSIAVSGVCLTAVEIEPESGVFHADLAAETVTRTSLSLLAPQSVVNLELPTPAGEPLGGHIVQGHVDGTGKLLSLKPVERQAESAIDSAILDWRLRISVPQELSRYVVEKGSIAIEGISLTIAQWTPRTPEGDVLEVAIIPHTYAHTNLHTLRPGQLVNLETDVMLKFFEKQKQDSAFELTAEYLIENGY